MFMFASKREKVTDPINVNESVFKVQLKMKEKSVTTILIFSIASWFALTLFHPFFSYNFVVDM